MNEFSSLLSNSRRKQYDHNPIQQQQHYPYSNNSNRTHSTHLYPPPPPRQEESIVDLLSGDDNFHCNNSESDNIASQPKLIATQHLEDEDIALPLPTRCTPNKDDDDLLVIPVIPHSKTVHALQSRFPVRSRQSIQSQGSNSHPGEVIGQDEGNVVQMRPLNSFDEDDETIGKEEQKGEGVWKIQRSQASHAISNLFGDDGANNDRSNDEGGNGGDIINTSVMAMREGKRNELQNRGKILNSNVRSGGGHNDNRVPDASRAISNLFGTGYNNHRERQEDADDANNVPTVKERTQNNSVTSIPTSMGERITQKDISLNDNAIKNIPAWNDNYHYEKNGVAPNDYQQKRKNNDFTNTRIKSNTAIARSWFGGSLPSFSSRSIDVNTVTSTNENDDRRVYEPKPSTTSIMDRSMGMLHNRSRHGSSTTTDMTNILKNPNSNSSFIPLSQQPITAHRKSTYNGDKKHYDPFHNPNNTSPTPPSFLSNNSSKHPTSSNYWNTLNLALALSIALTNVASSIPIALIPTIAMDVLSPNIENDDGVGDEEATPLDTYASTFASTVAAYAVFGTALGKLVNGPMGDIFGARRVACLYALLLSASLISLSCVSDGSVRGMGVIWCCVAVEFFQSVQWPCVAIVLAAHYGSGLNSNGSDGLEENEQSQKWKGDDGGALNYVVKEGVGVGRYEAGIYVASIGSRFGSLMASFSTTMLLRNEGVEWRVIARLAALTSFLGCLVFYFLVTDSPGKLHDPQNPFREPLPDLDFSEINYTGFGHGRRYYSSSTAFSQRINRLCKIIGIVFMRNVVPSLRSVLSSGTFWIVAIAHSGGAMVLTSVRILGTYFRDTSYGAISENQAGAVSAVLSVGTLVGLGVGGNVFAKLSFDAKARKSMVSKLYILTVSMCYTLSLLAIPAIRSWLHSSTVVALLQAMATFCMGAGVAVQVYCIPAIVGATFGVNKGLYLAYTDGVAYGVSSIVWGIVGGAVEEGNPQGAGWAYGWAAVALLVILAGLLMVEFVEHYFCRGGWKGRLRRAASDAMLQKSKDLEKSNRDCEDDNNSFSKWLPVNGGNFFSNDNNSIVPFKRPGMFFRSRTMKEISFDTEDDDDEVSTIEFEDTNSSVVFRTNDKNMTIAELNERVEELSNFTGNDACVDCCNPYPRWASIIVPILNKNTNHRFNSKAIGCFCCTECAGSHRKLGTHIVFVRSIDHDSFKEHEVKALQDGGNAKVNSIFEALLEDKTVKPLPSTQPKIREQFIVKKYGDRQWYSVENHVQLTNSQSETMSLTNRGIDFEDKRGLLNSIELVRSVSVLSVDDDTSEKGINGSENLFTMNENYKEKMGLKKTKTRAQTVFDEAGHLNGSIRAEYESFINQGDDSASESGEQKYTSEERVERRLSGSSCDTSEWHLSNENRGFSEVINL